MRGWQTILARRGNTFHIITHHLATHTFWLRHRGRRRQRRSSEFARHSSIHKKIVLWCYCVLWRRWVDGRWREKAILYCIGRGCAGEEAGSDGGLEDGFEPPPCRSCFKIVFFSWPLFPFLTFVYVCNVTRTETGQGKRQGYDAMGLMRIKEEN